MCVQYIIGDTRAEGQISLFCAMQCGHLADAGAVRAVFWRRSDSGPRSVHGIPPFPRLSKKIGVFVTVESVAGMVRTRFGGFWEVGLGSDVVEAVCACPIAF